MRALILADRSFAARERDMLTRVQVGLIDEGVRVVEAIPSDVADPDANPLIPTIPYSDRIVLLDHLTRGRFQFGVGPGALSSDALMMGIEPVTQRPRVYRLVHGGRISTCPRLPKH